MGKLLLGKTEEKVRLILGAIPASQQPETAAALRRGDSSVVPGGQPRDAQIQGIATEEEKLDPRVAEHTGVGSHPLSVDLEERLDHLLSKGVTKIDAVERNPEPLRQKADGLTRGARIIGSEAHVERHYPVAAPLEEQGGHGAVHPAAQGNGYGFIGFGPKVFPVGGG